MLVVVVCCLLFVGGWCVVCDGCWLLVGVLFVCLGVVWFSLCVFFCMCVGVV